MHSAKLSWVIQTQQETLIQTLDGGFNCTPPHGKVLQLKQAILTQLLKVCKQTLASLRREKALLRTGNGSFSSGVHLHGSRRCCGYIKLWVWQLLRQLLLFGNCSLCSQPRYLRRSYPSGRIHTAPC